MWRKIKGLSITAKIFIGLVLGIIAGLVFRESMANFAFVGTMWMNALKIAIAPMVFIMMILGIGQQDDPRRMGRVSVELLIYYVFTTFMAGVIGITIASITKAGVGFQITEAASEMDAVEMTFSKFFVSLIPDNFLAPLVNGALMQVLILGAVCGIVVMKMNDAAMKSSIIRGCETIRGLLNGILRMVLEVAPIGIFCYMGSIVGTNGSEVMLSMGRFLSTMIFADVIMIVVVYGLIVFALGMRKSPLAYWKNMVPSWVIAFTTVSSVLVIPSNTSICTDKYDCDPAITNFGIPLGAVFNFDGAGIFLPCVIVFASQAVGVSYSFGTLLYMALIGTLISSSGGGVFGGALVKLLVMCELFSVPSSIVTMIAGMFAIIDMFITVVNISGDVAGTVLVDQRDKRRKAKAAKAAMAAQ